MSTLKDDVGFGLAAMMDPVRESLSEALPAVSEFAKTVLAALGPPVAAAANTFAGALRVVLDVFNRLGAPFQAAIVYVAAFDIAVVAAVGSMSMILPYLASTTLGLIAMGKQAWVAAANWAQLVAHMGGARVVMAGLGRSMYAAIAPVLPIIAALAVGFAGLILIIGSLRLLWDEFGDSIKKMVNDAGRGFDYLFQGIGDWIDTAIGWFDELLTTARNFWIKLAIEQGKLTQEQGASMMADSVFGDVREALAKGKQMGEFFAEGVSDSVSGIAGNIKTVFSAGLDTTGLRTVIDAIDEAMNFDLPAWDEGDKGGGSGGKKDDWLNDSSGFESLNDALFGSAEAIERFQEDAISLRQKQLDDDARAMAAEEVRLLAVLGVPAEAALIGR
jgi:hypothetical protein